MNVSYKTFLKIPLNWWQSFLGMVLATRDGVYFVLLILSILLGIFVSYQLGLVVFFGVYLILLFLTSVVNSICGVLAIRRDPPNNT